MYAAALLHAAVQVGGICCLCEQKPMQAYSCCPKAFYADHAVSKAFNAKHPIGNSGGCQMFICNFRQHNRDRTQANHMHSFCLEQSCYPQQLYTATGLWLSTHLKNPEPPLSPKDFSAMCYKRDLINFEHKVCVSKPVYTFLVMQTTV